MSNIQDNSQPSSPLPTGKTASTDAQRSQLKVDVQSHLDDEPDPAQPGLAVSGLRELPKDFELVLSAAAITASALRGFTAGEIEIAVVDDQRIHQLNQRHLDHDWETDVISFPYELADNVVRGELIISWETAIRESSLTGWPAMTELALYVIHGTLHLTGMDDLTDDQRQEMRVAERQVMEHLGLEQFDRYDVAGQEAH